MKQIREMVDWLFILPQIIRVTLELVMVLQLISKLEQLVEHFIQKVCFLQ